MGPAVKIKRRKREPKALPNLWRTLPLDCNNSVKGKALHSSYFSSSNLQYCVHAYLLSNEKRKRLKWSVSWAPLLFGPQPIKLNPLIRCSLHDYCFVLTSLTVTVKIIYHWIGWPLPCDVPSSSLTWKFASKANGLHHPLTSPSSNFFSFPLFILFKNMHSIFMCLKL